MLSSVANHLVPTLNQISKSKTPLLVLQSTIDSGYLSRIKVHKNSKIDWLTLISDVCPATVIIRIGNSVHFLQIEHPKQIPEVISQCQTKTQSS